MPESDRSAGCSGAEQQAVAEDKQAQNPTGVQIPVLIIKLFVPTVLNHGRFNNTLLISNVVSHIILVNLKGCCKYWWLWAGSRFMSYSGSEELLTEDTVVV